MLVARSLVDFFEPVTLVCEDFQVYGQTALYTFNLTLLGVHTYVGVWQVALNFRKQYLECFLFARVAPCVVGEGHCAFPQESSIIFA